MCIYVNSIYPRWFASDHYLSDVGKILKKYKIQNSFPKGISNTKNFQILFQIENKMILNSIGYFFKSTKSIWNAKYIKLFQGFQI